jgi:hypothetical protein
MASAKASPDKKQANVQARWDQHVAATRLSGFEQRIHRETRRPSVEKTAQGRKSMSDFIYDDQGKCVAWIVHNEVFSEANGRKIAAVRDGKIFDFDGNLVGHLQNDGLVRKEGDSTPPEFTRLLS